MADLHKMVNFIVPYSPGDETVHIQNVNNIETFEIVADYVVAIYADNNFIKVKQQGSDRTLSIMFASSTEAIQSLILLQTAIDYLKSVTTNIPNDIKQYIQSVLNTQSVEFQQTVNSSTWSVTHGLGRSPNVRITDSNFNTIQGCIKDINDDQLVLLFNSEITGWAFLS